MLLDNCEHLVAAVAALLVGGHRARPRVQVLATSQEPLRVRGEQVFRLGTLGLARRRDGRPGVSAGCGAFPCSRAGARRRSGASR